MLLVNLYGAPGAGKSTGAAYVFSKLKMMGINAELVTEYAKDKVWEGSEGVFQNQTYIFAKQYFRLTRCMDKVDVIVTDSPLLLNLLYMRNNKGELLYSMDYNKLLDEDPVKVSLLNHIRKVDASFNSMNFFIERVKEYNTSGRFQDEHGSDELGNETLKMLKHEELNDVANTLSLPAMVVSGDTAGYENIINAISFRRAISGVY